MISRPGVSAGCWHAEGLNGMLGGSSIPFEWDARAVPRPVGMLFFGGFSDHFRDAGGMMSDDD